MKQQQAQELEAVALFNEGISLERSPTESGRINFPAFRVAVDDIWESSAGDLAAQLVHRLLDVLGIDAKAQFELKFQGERSVELTLEVRKRQKAGELIEW